MYYSNIADEEARYFHGLTVPNFTIKLSDILHQISGTYDNKLFKIEQITSTIYRIYPMFYCETITSTNPNDKIMENKLLIAKQQDNETYITFIGDSNNPDIQDYINYGTYYSIGDSLTTNQFNSIVQLLKANTVHTDSFRLNEQITGTYGTYEFDLEDVSFLDTGILITNQTITAEPKVKLSAPVFRWTTYTLKLTVFHYTGVNILDDITPSDLKVVETLEIELVEDTWVDIPVETLEQNYIISFDATVEVKHNKPEIHIITDIEVSASPEIIQSGNSTDIYGQLIDTDGKPYNINDASGTTIHFYEKLVPSISLIADPSIIQTGDHSEIYATVKDEDGSIAKYTRVNFYKVFPNVLYFNKGDYTYDLNVDPLASVTVSDNSLKIMGLENNTEAYVRYPVVLNSNMNFLFECEIAKIGETQSIALFLKDTTHKGCHLYYQDSLEMLYWDIMGHTNYDSTSLSVGDKLKIKQENGVITLYHNDTVLLSYTASLSGDYYVGHFTNKDGKVPREQYVKNIKIIDLDEE